MLDDDALDKHELERLAVLHKGVNVHERFNFVSPGRKCTAALNSKAAAAAAAEAEAAAAVTTYRRTTLPLVRTDTS